MGTLTNDHTTRNATWRQSMGRPWEDSEGREMRCDEPVIVGECYWAVLRRDGKPLCVVLALIGGPRDPDAVGTCSSKEMTEHEGPHYYNCPSRLLDATPEPEAGSYAAEWREQVRAGSKGGR